MDLLDKKNYSKYFLYAIIEIVLIVIGILIALQINNWNLRQIERNEELRTYQNIQHQMSEDRSELVEMQAFNRTHLSQMEIANSLISENNRRAIDTLAYLIMMMSQYSDFHGSANIYETLVNSGDIKLIQNDEIPARIKNLEKTYTFVNHLEDIHWAIIIEELSKELRGVMNYHSFEKGKPDRILEPDKLYSPEIQNIVYEVKYLTIGKDSIYGRAIREIDDINNLIDLEMGDETIK